MSDKTDKDINEFLDFEEPEKKTEEDEFFLDNIISEYRADKGETEENSDESDTEEEKAAILPLKKLLSKRGVQKQTKEPSEDDDYESDSASTDKKTRTGGILERIRSFAAQTDDEDEDEDTPIKTDKKPFMRSLLEKITAEVEDDAEDEEEVPSASEPEESTEVSPVETDSPMETTVDENPAPKKVRVHGVRPAVHAVKPEEPAEFGEKPEPEFYELPEMEKRLHEDGIETQNESESNEEKGGVFRSFMDELKRRIENSRDSRDTDGLGAGDAFDEDYDVDDEDRYGEHFTIADKIAEFIAIRRQRIMERQRSYYNEDENYKIPDREYVPEEEPNYVEESKRFSAGLAGLALREMISFVIAFFSVALIVLYDAKIALPFGLSEQPMIFCAILMILQFINMGLGIECLIGGIADMIHLDFSAESLLVISSLFTTVDGFVILIQKTVTIGLPFCTVVTVAMYFAILGRKCLRLSMAESFRMAATARNTTAVLIDDESIDGKAILKKGRHGVSGFRRLAVRPDFSEILYTIAAPALAVVCLILGVITAYANESAAAFAHSLASLFAVAASFSSFIAFAVPYRAFTKRIHATGAAVAGWAGVTAIAEADGTLMTDSDVFPKGTAVISGVQIFEGFTANKAIGCAGSLVSLASSDLSSAFEDFMHVKGVNKYTVEGFTFYEGGGLGGRIYADNVLVGPSAFMNLMGVRIPGELNDKNNLFVSVSHQLAAVFTISYHPANSVRRAMAQLVRSKVKVLFASKDANLTPVMLKQRFKVTADSFEYVPVEDCYRISAEPNDMDSNAVGFVCRQGLLPYSSVTIYAKRIKYLTMLSAVLSVISALVGIFYVFTLCWTGCFAVNTALNILLYQLLSQALIYILTFILVRI